MCIVWNRLSYIKSIMMWRHVSVIYISRFHLSLSCYSIHCLVVTLCFKCVCRMWRSVVCVWVCGCRDSGSRMNVYPCHFSLISTIAKHTQQFLFSRCKWSRQCKHFSSEPTQGFFPRTQRFFPLHIIWLPSHYLLPEIAFSVSCFWSECPAYWNHPARPFWRFVWFV